MPTAVRVTCPNCQQGYQVQLERIGRQVTCKKCNEPFVLQTESIPPKPSFVKKPDTQGPLEISEFIDNQPEKPKSFWDRTKAFVEKQKVECPLKYLHGPLGNVKPGTLVYLKFEDGEFIVDAQIIFKREELLRIPLTSIIGTEVETAKRMTLTRFGAGFLLAGPLGALIGVFGFKKKDRLLRIDFNDSGVESSIVFGKTAGNPVERADGMLHTALRDYRKRTGTPASSSKNTAEPSAGTDDIATALEKLAALKEQGILTEEEFTAKKTELLSRM